MIFYKPTTYVPSRRVRYPSPHQLGNSHSQLYADNEQHIRKLKKFGIFFSKNLKIIEGNFYYRKYAENTKSAWRKR